MPNQDKAIVIRDRLIEIIGAITQGVDYNYTIAKATADMVEPSESDNTPLAIVDAEREEYDDQTCDQLMTRAYFNIAVYDKAPLDDDYQSRQGRIGLDIRRAIQRDTTLQNGANAIRAQVTGVVRSLADEEGWFSLRITVRAIYYDTYRSPGS